MSEHLHNETLEQQRRARQDFLELKKMQSGEIDATATVEEKIVPKTFREKVLNYWYHFKWHTIISVALVVIFTVMVAQCVNREKIDLEVIAFSYTYLSDEQLKNAEKYLENFIDDIDGDGKVNIQLTNCSFVDDQTNGEYSRTVLTKVQAKLAAEPKCLLFITDDQGYEYLNKISDGNLFEDNRIFLGKDFYDACNKDTKWGVMPEGLSIVCRKVTGTTIEKDKKITVYYKESQKIMTAMEKDAKK